MVDTTKQHHHDANDDNNTNDKKNNDDNDNRPLTVAYLGPAGSFSHQAALAVLPSADLIPFPSFPQIFESLQRSGNGDSNSNSNSNSNNINNSTDSTPIIDFALLPIENSTNGSVVQALDLLGKCSDAAAAAASGQYPDIQVCEEHYLPVHHYVYTSASNNSSNSSSSSSSTSNIKVLYTHPQVWTQCSKYLAQHFPHAERIDVSSTSAAAALVAKDNSNHNNHNNSGGSSSAAICSQLAGEAWKLSCLAEQIEDEPGKNTTRFFVLRNRTRRPPPPRGLDLLPSRRWRQRRQQQQELGLGVPQPPPPPPSQQPLIRQSRTDSDDDDQINTRALVLFTLDHAVPGSLSKALQVFAKHGLNLTRIDTRPSRQRSWHYIFFVECEERVKKDFDDDGDDDDHDDSDKSAPSATKTTTTTTTKLQETCRELVALTESVTCLGRWVDMLQFEE